MFLSNSIQLSLLSSITTSTSERVKRSRLASSLFHWEGCPVSHWVSHSSMHTVVAPNSNTCRVPQVVWWGGKGPLLKVNNSTSTVAVSGRMQCHGLTSQCTDSATTKGYPVLFLCPCCECDQINGWWRNLSDLNHQLNHFQSDVSKTKGPQG